MFNIHTTVKVARSVSQTHTVPMNILTSQIPGRFPREVGLRYVTSNFLFPIQFIICVDFFFNICYSRSMYDIAHSNHVHLATCRRDGYAMICLVNHANHDISCDGIYLNLAVNDVSI